MSRQSRKLAAQRLKETVNYLWTSYKADRGNVEIRNRLAEHYTPLVQEIALRCIQHYRLREVDTAMGDALLLLVLRIIPHYDGVRTFRGWATHCIRQKLLERKRLEMHDRQRFRKNEGAESDWTEIEALFVRPKEPGADARFAELTAALPARSAALMWLRFYRHLSFRQIGFIFNTNPRTIAKQIRQAIGILQELVGRVPDEEEDVEYEEDEEEHEDAGNDEDADESRDSEDTDAAAAQLVVPRTELGPLKSTIEITVWNAR